jgi:hypothetical protein
VWLIRVAKKAIFGVFSVKFGGCAKSNLTLSATTVGGSLSLSLAKLRHEHFIPEPEHDLHQILQSKGFSEEWIADAHSMTYLIGAVLI